MIYKAIAEHDFALLSRCRTKRGLIRKVKTLEHRTFAEIMSKIGNKTEQENKLARKPEMFADWYMSEKRKIYPEESILQEQRENLRQALHGIWRMRQPHRRSYRWNAENEHQIACLLKAYRASSELLENYYRKEKSDTTC